MDILRQRRAALSDSYKKPSNPEVSSDDEKSPLSPGRSSYQIDKYSSGWKHAGMFYVLREIDVLRVINAILVILSNHVQANAKASEGSAVHPMLEKPISPALNNRACHA